MNSSREHLHREIHSSILFIKENWKDEIAEQYLLFLESVESKLRASDQSLELIVAELSKIVDICEKADKDTDYPAKVLRR